MGTRNYVFDALVLKRWPIGDTHRGVGFLTRERGPLTAIAHGAAQSKGKLKLLTAPIRRVRLHAYHDPVADNWKVVDLEAIDLYGGLAEDLDRSATASLWSELLWLTQSPGQESEVYELFVEALWLLDRSSGTAIARLNLQVLWRCLDLSGLAPEFSYCTECGRVLSGLPVFLLTAQGETVCPTCSRGRGSRISSASVENLLALEIAPLSESLTAPFEADELARFTRELLLTWEKVLGVGLKSIRVFQGGQR